jgi:DNA helicase II / ATP-dependent DNA helicase PcrA
MSFSQISESDIDRLLARLNSGESDPSRHLSLDEPRRSAILNYTDVQACPGSGKTTLVGLKLLLLLKNWHDAYSGICVLTHSNVAIAEIVSRVGSDVAGSKLLSYPHFVGTIQDFTNTFLALPYARSREWDVHLAEEGEFASFVESANVWNFKVHDREANKKYLFSSYFKRNKINPALFSLEHKDGLLKVSAAFMDGVNQLVDLKKGNCDETHFLKIRLRLCKKGLFLYSEMYELAKQAVASNSDLLVALRSRFMITILDEMQDTQRHQDDLLNVVFPPSECAIQRFGDPDQSIFDAMGGGLPNTTYNDAALHCITESHRFVQSIASALGALSYRRVGPFTGSRPQLADGPRNTIFLFEDSSIGRVLPAFAELALTLPMEHRSVIKAVGGIGRAASTTGLTLPSYWAAFDSKTQSSSFRARSLCDAVRCCTRAGEGDVASRYQVLQIAVLEWMRRAGRQYTTRSGKTMSFNRAMLNSYLKESDKTLAFGEVMNFLVNGKFPTEDVWTGIVEELRSLLELGDLNEKAAEFSAYDTFIEEEADNEEGLRNPNIYDAVAGVRIALATIHSVKGETHDATLVCETKYRSWYDIQEMAEFLCNPDAARPVADYVQPNSKATNRAAFMKRLFVAMSRPRYLLCLAVKKSHLTEAQRNHLRDAAGWAIEDLTVANGSAES